MSKLTLSIDTLRSDQALKLAIESYQPRGFFDYSATRGGTAEFQLAALVVILELYKNEAPYKNTNRKFKPPRLPTTAIRADRGMSMAAQGMQQYRTPMRRQKVVSKLPLFQFKTLAIALQTKE